eukprot:g7614.t1
MGLEAEARPLPKNFLPLHKEQTKKILSTMKEDHKQSPVVLGVYGYGGVGKSVLATSIVQDKNVETKFQNHMIWIEPGQHATERETLRKLLICSFGIEMRDDNGKSVEIDEIYKICDEYFMAEESPMLIVVDDIWKRGPKRNRVDVLKIIRKATKKHKKLTLLITTRNKKCLPEEGEHDDLVSKHFHLKLLSEEASLKLLEKNAGPFSVDSDADFAKRSAILVGNLPVALKVVGSRAKVSGWEEVYHRLKDENTKLKVVTEVEDDEDELYGNDADPETYDRNNDQKVELAFTACIDPEWIGEQLYRKYLLLAAFPEDTQIRLDTLQELWGEDDEASVKNICDEFDRLSLLEYRSQWQHYTPEKGFGGIVIGAGKIVDQIWLHNLQHVFVRKLCAEKRLLEAEENKVNAVCGIFVQAAGVEGSRYCKVGTVGTTVVPGTAPKYMQESVRVLCDSALCKLVNVEEKEKEKYKEVQKKVKKRIERSTWLKKVVLGKRDTEDESRTAPYAIDVEFNPCDNDNPNGTITVLTQQFYTEDSSKTKTSIPIRAGRTMTLMHDLIYCGSPGNEKNENALEILADYGANVMAQDILGDTLLHISLKNGKYSIGQEDQKKVESHTSKVVRKSILLENVATPGTKLRARSEKVVEILTSHGANVFAKNSQGETPLHLAAKNENLKVAEILLNKIPHNESVDVRTNKSSITPMHCAAELGNKVFVKLLVEKGADPNFPDINGWTPMHYAGALGQVNVLEFLADKANMNLEDKKFQWTPMHYAAREGHTEAIATLIKFGAKKNVGDIYGHTPIHIAAGNGREKVVGLLVEKCGVKVDVVDTQGNTLVHTAAARGHGKMVKLLADTYNANVDHQNEKGDTPMHYAACYGHKNVVDILLGKGCNGKLEVRNKDGATPLVYAVQNGHVEIVELLAKKYKAPVNAKITGYFGFTPMHFAAANGEEDVVKMLEKYGAKVDAMNDNGDTPMHIAADKGHDKVVRLLAQYDAKVDAMDDKGNTPMHSAAFHGDEKVVRLLAKEFNADVNHQNKMGEAPLHIAAYNGHKNVVDILLGKECGAKVDALDDQGNTPVFHAALYGHDKVVRLLAEEFDFDVNHRNKSGLTPLHCAAGIGHDKVVKLLAQYGANVDAMNDQGNTPMHHAANRGHDKVVKLLAQYGAKVDAMGEEGNTPMLIAAAKGHDKVVRLLARYGAKVDALVGNAPTPMHLAASGGHEAIVKVLAKYGAKVDVVDTQGNTLVHAAADHGQDKMVKLLADTYNANVDHQNGKGDTPLHLAACNGHKNAVDILLGKGCDAKLEVQNKDGATPLVRAVQNGRAEIVELLAEKYKAPVNTKNPGEGGFTPMHLAAYGGYEAVVKVLAKYGAKVDALDDNFKTPMHHAAYGGHEAVVIMLVIYGAKVDARDNFGKTPMHYADSQGHKKVVKLTTALCK